MKKALQSVLIVFFATVLNGCQKDSVNDGELTYNFKTSNLSASLSSTASASGTPVAPLSNGSITWKSGTVNIQQIYFGAKKDNTPFAVEFEKLSNIDILKVSTVSGSVAIPTGTYSDIKLRLRLKESATNKPLVLLGTYTEISGTKIPIEIQFNETYELTLTPPALTIKGDKYDVNVNLDLSKLAKNLTLSDFGQTTRSGADNMILVNSSKNVALFEKLKANFLLIADAQITKK
ncbi:hypothetical protein [Daejeonella lutea]|uniref:DUF4382 domain-containing protein n=1 Tax=Daejeonella lutea TaxID=572036 RepID=A0A1T5EI55_9SPHI|nr:hypothetical protein [Daejeonella lutea]SKB83495.1 hypothetical protein SAMN05661099_3023 [Daejeonella lutea]